MVSRLWGVLAVLVLRSGACAQGTEAAAQLRLIPFPREVRLSEGAFRLPKETALWVPATMAAGVIPGELSEELRRLGSATEIRNGPPAKEGQDRASLFLTEAAVAAEALPGPLTPPDHSEGYALTVSPAGMAATGADAAGLFYAAQTLCQLLRANVADGVLPDLTISDYPALRHRGFQDDLTRGPSTLLGVLKREVEIGALAKMNFFTYYIEHQFAFSKHPEIGPPDGSLTPDELSARVEHAKGFHAEIVGCQQSFGHFYHILKHDEYKDLRETGGILSPVNEKSYQLLDDLYSEQAPLTSSPFFNVCCDETYGLGEGPSKELAKEIGVGGVYARHMRRVHDLVAKQGKRMMMWGDIILQHPEDLKEIPKDTVMLTWGYGPAASFENQIIPFAESGYEFFVCPGVNCWSRLLPDFAATTVNVQNFVRDGVKRGALGMLNTAWDDDGETFCAPNWHGVLWGAECAWTGSTTDPRDFNRRLGGVLFGEQGDDFGQAIELLAKTHSLPGYGGMMDRRFWQLDLANVPTSIPAARKQAGELLKLTQPALEHLRRAQQSATVNADLLDYFVFGAERMQLTATRRLDFLEAANEYDRAGQAAGGLAAARTAADSATTLLRKIRDQHADLRTRYVGLWNRENKPYALDWTTGKFAKVVAAYDGLLQQVTAAAEGLTAGKPLPSPEAAGLAVVETGVRATHPTRVADAMDKALPWQEPTATSRCGLAVEAGKTDRQGVPVEIDLALPEGAQRSVRLYQLAGQEQQPVPCQMEEVLDEQGGRHSRLTFVLPGKLDAGQTARLCLYAVADAPPDKAPALRCEKTETGDYWIENECLRLFVGREGAHLYHWIVKRTEATAAVLPEEGVDLTQPGETGWAGFADMTGASRSSPNELRLVQAGPAMARLRCVDESGLTKTISVYAGQPWVEVTLDSPTGWFWNYDDQRVLSAEGEVPAQYLFAGGSTGPVGKNSEGLDAQVKRSNLRWGAKFAPDRLLLALVTPEVDALHCIGPGGGWGGVGIEGSPAPASHFVTYGGVCPEDPTATLNLLRQSLDFADQPKVTTYRWERR